MGLLSDAMIYWGDKSRTLAGLLQAGAEQGASMVAPTRADRDMRMKIGGLLAEVSPGLGDALAVKEGIHAAQQGDMLGAGLGALGALPFVPNIGLLGHMGHAKKGGERGVNGEWYEGGKFLPSTDAAKKSPSKFPAGGKVEIAPWIYGQRPADDLQPLWNQFRDGVAGGTVRAPKGTPLSEIKAEFRQPPDQYIAYTFNGDADAAAKFIADKKADIAAWNAGARYIKTDESGVRMYFDESGKLLNP